MFQSVIILRQDVVISQVKMHLDEVLFVNYY